VTVGSTVVRSAGQMAGVLGGGWMSTGFGDRDRAEWCGSGGERRSIGRWRAKRDGRVGSWRLATRLVIPEPGDVGGVISAGAGVGR